MTLYYGSVEALQKLQFQVLVTPFFMDKDGNIQLPPGFLEAEKYLGPEYQQRLREKIVDIPNELKANTTTFLFVESPNKPAVLFFPDMGISALNFVLHNALGIANTKGVNIALLLFRNHFGQYYTPESVIVEITIDACREFNHVQLDNDIHIALSLRDQFAYERLRTCTFAHEEYAPNFDKKD